MNAYYSKSNSSQYSFRKYLPPYYERPELAATMPKKIFQKRKTHESKA